MKKISTLLFLSLMLFISLSVQAQYKVLKTYGFESTPQDVNMASTIDTVWTQVYPASTGQMALVDNDADNAHSGKGYGYWAVAKNTVNDWDNQMAFQHMPVEDSTIYRFTLWAKGNTDGKVNKLGTMVGELNVTAGWDDYTLSSNFMNKYHFLLTNTYQPAILMIWVGTRSQPGARFPIHFGSVGLYYIDDMSFVRTHLSSAVVKDDSLTVDFGWSLDSTAAVHAIASKFLVKRGDKVDTVKTATWKNKSRSILKLKLAHFTLKDEIITLGYDKAGALEYDANETSAPPSVLTSFSGEPVINNSTGTGTGISAKTIANGSLNLYPNPAADNIRLQGFEGIRHVEITNLSGQVLKSIVTSETNVNISNLSTGIYFVKVTHQGGVNVLKFVKK